MNTFDPLTHTYEIDGVVVPGVTQICNPGIAPWYTDEATQRGTHVHRACELYDRGMLDEETLDPQLRPYLDAWKEFVHRYGNEWVAIEQQFFSAAHGFAGTVDRVLPAGVLEIKTGAAFPDWLDLQLGGYSILTGAGLYGTGVLLMPNGKFRTSHFGATQMAQARGKFLAALREVRK